MKINGWAVWGILVIVGTWAHPLADTEGKILGAAIGICVALMGKTNG